MGVLKKNSADPFRDGKQEHVVAKRSRPIRHGEADAFARDHAPTANEKQGRDCSQPREAIQPFVVAAVCDRRSIRDRSAHG
jgi:hypothetical protein